MVLPYRVSTTTTLCAALAVAFTNHSAFASQTLTDEACLTLGFDPSNLSCETCHLIEQSPSLSSLQREYNAKHPSDDDANHKNIDLVEECKSCCQSHKFNPMLHPGQSLRGKYKYALLSYDEGSLQGMYTEINDFIERDLNDVLSFKGENRLRVTATSDNNDGMDVNMLRQLMMMGGGGPLGGLGGGGPPKLLLFEKAKKGGDEKWTENDEDEAGEVINLRGWKREDLKDM